jgi:plasmid stability protein
MPTLYVEKVPDELYEALRARARQHRKSIAAEVLTLLEENIPTAKELAQRKEFLQRVRKLRAKRSGSSGPFPASEEILREDRNR